MPKSRRLFAAVATIGLAAAFATVAAPAYAVLPTDPAQIDILVFGKSDLNDVAQEVALETASLQATGAVVTGFDGGDGSDIAWSAALAGKDILVLPELEGGLPFYETGGTATVSTAAAAVITAWVNAGGVIIMNSNYDGSGATYGQTLSTITGKDYASVFGRSLLVSGVWELQGTFPGLQPTIDWADGTYGLSQYGTWSADLKSIVQPIYVTADGQDLAAGNFSVGSGYVTFLGYDWYPAGSASVNDWNTLLRLVATGVIAPPAPVVVAPAAVPVAVVTPTLAATGSDTELPLVAAGLLLLAGLGIVVARRRLVA